MGDVGHGERAGLCPPSDTVVYIFLCSFWELRPRPPPGPDLPLLFKLHDIWLVGSQENHKNCFKAKMHQIRFQLGLPHRPDAGAYSAPPDSLAGFKGPTSKGREREGGKERPSFTGRFGTWNFLSFIPSFCPK